MPTVAQIKAARHLVGWNQGDLARAAGVTKNTVSNLERSAPVYRTTMASVVDALSAAGVRFSEGDEVGVSLRP